MLRKVAAGVVFCSIAIAQEPASLDPASSTQPRSGVRAGFWWADYDRDGLDDAFVVAADGTARLLRNSGDGSFADVTQISGLDGLGAASFAAWQDFDRDGAADVFVGTQSGPGHLMRNAGDGTFQDVTQFVGLVHSGRHLAAQWFDYDLDGLIDFAVRTDAGEHLYHALPNGHFEVVDLGSVNPRPIVDLAADLSTTVQPDENGDKPTGRRPIRPPTGPTGARPSATPTWAAPPPTPPGSWLLSACPPKITDTATSSCLQASSVATLGMLFPLTIDLNVSGAGNVGIGTTTPTAKLVVVGTALVNDTLTLNPSSDQALNISTGSIYKGGVLFMHTHGGSNNTAMGREALGSVTSGSSNTASGYRSLFFNTYGIANTASGERALYSNTSGFGNTASGVQALLANTSGSLNTANGSFALSSNTTGSYNTASGVSALAYNTTGAANTATGYRALASNTSGTRNTASGDRALFANTTGSLNTADGYQALRFNTTGTRNTASGDRALYFNTTGSSNTASGVDALRLNRVGNSNTAFGAQALYFNNSGGGNTANGAEALRANRYGFGNTASGFRALGLNTIGYHNTACGVSALYSNISGTRNTASGADALRSNTFGHRNTASGYGALLSNTSGLDNTANGYKALSANTTGNGNTASGISALSSNTIGFANTASGNKALFSNTTGTGNTASGYKALFSNTGGTDNTSSGNKALINNTTGANNVAIGYRALFSNTAGSGNIALGHTAGQNLTTGQNNIAIGNVGVAGNSGTIRIGNQNMHGETFIAGIRAITTGNANATPVLIDSAGQLGTVSSSRRFKKDIVDMGDATSRLLELRPVRFRYKQEQKLPDGSAVPMEYGLIAEEVAEILPDLVIYGDDGKPFTVKYHILSAMLLNEMEKQAIEIARQREELARLNGLDARLAALEARTAAAALPADDR